MSTVIITSCSINVQFSECVTKVPVGKKKMWPAQRLLKYGIVTGVTMGTLASLKANQYNFDSVGIVRLGRAAVTVSSMLI